MNKTTSRKGGCVDRKLMGIFVLMFTLVFSSASVFAGNKGGATNVRAKGTAIKDVIPNQECPAFILAPRDVGGTCGTVETEIDGHTDTFPNFCYGETKMRIPEGGMMCKGVDYICALYIASVTDTVVHDTSVYPFASDDFYNARFFSVDGNPETVNRCQHYTTSMLGSAHADAPNWVEGSTSHCKIRSFIGCINQSAIFDLEHLSR